MRWLKHPRAAVVLHDLVMVAAAWLSARWLQAEINPVPEWSALWSTAAILMVLTVQAVVLWRIGLYKGLWRFASFPDLWNLVRACTLGGLIISIGIMIA